MTPRTPALSPALSPLARALAVLSVTMVLNWGILFYSLALLAPRIRDEMQWSDTLIFGGFSMALLMTGVFSPMAGRGVDRHGGRIVMTIGILVGAIGFVVLSWATNPIVYLLAWALVGAGMAGSLYDPAFATLARIAGPGTRRAISILTLAGGFASTVSWPATLMLLEHTDWRSVALIYAGVLALVSAPLNAFGVPAHDARHTPEAATHSETSTAPAVESVVPRRDMTALVLFACVIAAHGFVTSAFSVHLVHTLDSLGIGEREAVIAGSLVGPAQVGARLIELLFGKRLSALWLGVIATALLPVSFAILLAIEISTPTAILFGIVYGASNGLVTIARGLVPYSLFGPEGYGRTLGLIAAPTLAVKAAAPMVFAFLMVTFGAWPTIWMSAGISLIAALAMVTLKLHRRRLIT